MPKLNPYLIKENYKKVEEVREIEEKELIMPEEQAKIVDKLVKNEIPSYEEFMKSYEEDEGVIDNYYYEVDSHGDIRVVKCYGPSFWSELGEGLWEVGKFTGKVVTTGAIAASIVSTGGLAAPAIGGIVYAGGKIVKKAGEANDSEFFAGLGDFVEDVGIGGFTGGVLGTASSSLASKGANSALNASMKTAGTNGSDVLFKTWVYTKMAQEGYDLGGKSKNAVERFCYYYHGKHKNRGVSYDSECPICGGHFDKFAWL